MIYMIFKESLLSTTKEKHQRLSKEKPRKTKAAIVTKRERYFVTHQNPAGRHDKF